MTVHNLARLSFKFLALLAFLMAIGPGARVLPTIALNWPIDSDGGSLLLLTLSLLAPIIFPLMFCCLLWFTADIFAQKFFTKSDIDVGTFPSFEELQRLVFSVIGVIVLSTAIPNLTKIIYYYWQVSTPGGVQVGSKIERTGILIETATQVFIGIWLLFGASALSNCLRKLRGR